MRRLAAVAALGMALLVPGDARAQSDLIVQRTAPTSWGFATFRTTNPLTNVVEADGWLVVYDTAPGESQLETPTPPSYVAEVTVVDMVARTVCQDTAPVSGWAMSPEASAAVLVATTACGNITATWGGMGTPEVEPRYSVTTGPSEVHAWTGPTLVRRGRATVEWSGTAFRDSLEAQLGTWAEVIATVRL